MFEMQVVDEYFNFCKTAEAQADSAGRAFGALITKTITHGGLPFSVYSMIFEYLVCTVSDCGVEVSGFQSRLATNNIHLHDPF